MIAIMIFYSMFFTACSSSHDDVEEPQANIENVSLSENEIDKDKILRLVNEIRASGTTCDGVDYPSVAALTWNVKLEQAALNHCKDMKDNNFLDHNSSDGRTPGNRINQANYQYLKAGENVARGQETEEEVIQAWLNSQGHCGILMDADFTELGVGRLGNYWTQNFGKPK